MTKEKRIEVAIPIAIFLFAIGFAFVARHSSYKVGGGYFSLKANLYIPVVFVIASVWAIVLTLKGTLSAIWKTLSVLLIMISIALLSLTLYYEVHKLY